MRWLARAAHMRPDGQHDSLGVLREELKRQSLRVSRLHAKLFYQPLLESVEGNAVEFSPEHVARVGRTSARRTGIRGTAECTDPSGGAHRQ